MDFIMRNKVGVGIGVVLLMGAVWYSMSPSGTSTSLITSTPVTGNGPDQGLVETLIALRAVKLDGAIFSEAAFTGLEDFSTQIVPEPVGRSNPFAPLNNVSAATATTTQSAKIFSPNAIPAIPVPPAPKGKGKK